MAMGDAGFCLHFSGGSLSYAGTIFLCRISQISNYEKFYNAGKTRCQAYKRSGTNGKFIGDLTLYILEIFELEQSLHVVLVAVAPTHWHVPWQLCGGGLARSKRIRLQPEVDV